MKPDGQMNEQTFLRVFRGPAILCTTMAMLACVAMAAAAAQQRPPNVLLILADDLGYGDLSSYGAKDLRSPNVDRLAAAGMKLDNFYANCPVCSPTRAALLTGRYQDLVGVPGVIRTHARNSWGYLSPDAVLLPTVLKRGGYHTAIIGKWHLGLDPPNIPTQRGFDYFKGFLGDMMDDYYTHRRHGHNYMRENTDVIEPTGHATDLFSQWACQYLKSRRGGPPFFLYLAYNAPHTPIQPPTEWVNRVKHRQPNINDNRAKLVALIEHMDAGIGTVLHTLKQTGLDQNTLVIFTSDNGGYLRVGANCGRLRDGKGSMYEGGLRVPTIAAWPGPIKPGTRSDYVALTMDLYATIAQAAGISIEHKIDGVGFLPTLLGRQQPPPDRDLVFVRREGGAGYGGLPVHALRRGPWKLVHNSPWAPMELYNLAADPLETNDLAKKEVKRFNALSAALGVHIQRAGAVPWQPAPLIRPGDTDRSMSHEHRTRTVRF